jgi:hypothetical protein
MWQGCTVLALARRRAGRLRSRAGWSKEKPPQRGPCRGSSWEGEALRGLPIPRANTIRPAYQKSKAFEFRGSHAAA